MRALQKITLESILVQAICRKLIKLMPNMFTNVRHINTSKQWQMFLLVSPGYTLSSFLLFK